MPSRPRRLRPALCMMFFVSLPFYLSAQTAGPSPQESNTAAQAATSSQPGRSEPQDPQAVHESATVMRATTRMVVVDVVATDKRGFPITDLKAGDFTIRDDGHQQELRSFSFQRPAETSVAALPAPPAPRLPENIFTNVPRYKTDRPLNIILLDALNSTLINQINVHDETLKVLQKLPADRPTAVYALGDKLQVLQDFTSDPAVLRAAVINYSDHASQRLKNPVGDPISQAFMLTTLPSLPALQAYLRFTQNTVSMGADVRVALTLDALQAIARSLAAYPGRKNLIWISAAFPLSLNIDGKTKLKGEAAGRDYSRLVERMADSLMSAQVALYPVDARGMSGLSFLAASGATRNPYGGNYADGSGVGLEPVASDLSDELLAAHETMTILAERTGGKAYYNTNDLEKAIRAGMDDGAIYYTLGYYPSNKEWNGKFRRIQIKVEPPEANLRYRIGYFALDPEDYAHEDSRRRAHDLIQALSLETPPSTALLFQARVLPPSEKTRNKVLVDFAIDPHGLSFRHDDDGQEHAAVKCAVEVYSEKGEPLRTEASDITAALKPEAYQQVLRTNLPCRAAFELKQGSYFLRLAVRDERTGLIGSQNAELTVGAK